MLLAMKRLKKLPIETKLQRIVEVLDDDKDGKIDINLALKVDGCYKTYNHAFLCFYILPFPSAQIHNFEKKKLFVNNICS